MRVSILDSSGSSSVFGSSKMVPVWSLGLRVVLSKKTATSWRRAEDGFSTLWCCSGLSQFFGPHRVLGRELREFLSAYNMCAKANPPNFSQNSASLARSSASSLFRHSTLKQYSTRFLAEEVNWRSQTPNSTPHLREAMSSPSLFEATCYLDCILSTASKHEPRGLIRREVCLGSIGTMNGSTAIRWRRGKIPT